MERDGGKRWWKEEEDGREGRKAVEEGKDGRGKRWWREEKDVDLPSFWVAPVTEWVPNPSHVPIGP